MRVKTLLFAMALMVQHSVLLQEIMQLNLCFYALTVPMCIKMVRFEWKINTFRLTFDRWLQRV